MSNKEGRRKEFKKLNFIIRNSLFDIRYSIFTQFMAGGSDYRHKIALGDNP